MSSARVNARVARMRTARIARSARLGVSQPRRSRLEAPRAMPSFRRIGSHLNADVLVFVPNAFEDAGSDALAALGMGKTVLVNLNFIHGLQEQQRLLDFVTGGCFALGGTQTKVAEGVVLFAPKGRSVKELPAAEPEPQLHLDAGRDQQEWWDGVWDEE